MATRLARNTLAAALLAVTVLLAVASPAGAMAADPAGGSIIFGGGGSGSTPVPVVPPPIVENPPAPVGWPVGGVECFVKPSTLDIDIIPGGTWRLSGGFSTFFELPTGTWYQMDLTLVGAGTWTGGTPPHPIASASPGHITAVARIYDHCNKLSTVCTLGFRVVVDPSTSHFTDTTSPGAMFIDGTSATTGGINPVASGSCSAPFLSWVGQPVVFDGVTFAF